LAEEKGAQESRIAEKKAYKQRQCRFCADKSLRIDYKDYELLRSFLSERGKIRAKRVTGLCAKHQRKVANEIKKARFLALLPYTVQIYR